MPSAALLQLLQPEELLQDSGRVGHDAVDALAVGPGEVFWCVEDPVGDPDVLGVEEAD